MEQPATDFAVMDEEYICIDVLRDPNLTESLQWSMIDIPRICDDEAKAVEMLAACFAKNLPWYSISFKGANNWEQAVSK